MRNSNIFIGSARKIASSLFYKSPVNIGSDKKLISFTFDDVPKSTFDNAIPILNKYNIKGTFYVALSLMEGIHNSKGLFAAEDLHKCLNAGHELGCHSYSHIHFYDIHVSGHIKNDLKENQAALQSISPISSFENFSYPFGEQTIAGKGIVSGLYNSGRGTDNGTNVGNTDLNSLKAIKLYESKNSPEKIDNILRQFSKAGGWLIFYTHDVQENFSVSGCSPQYLDSVITKCLEMGFEIKNIKETLNCFDLKG